MPNLFTVAKSVLAGLLLAIFCYGQSSTPITTPKINGKDLDDSKKLVLRVLAQFGQNLDLRATHRELYVKDRAIRRLVMESVLSEIVEENVVNKLNTYDLEKAFLAADNLNWLSWSFFYREASDGRLDAIEPKEFAATIQPRIWPRLNSKQKAMFQEYFDVGSKQADYDTTKLISRAELADWIKMTQIMNDAWRPLFPKQLRKNFSEGVEIQAFAHASEYGFEVLKTNPIVKVRAEIKGIWGVYTFTTVKERGTWKILTFVIHDGG